MLRLSNFISDVGGEREDAADVPQGVSPRLSAGLLRAPIASNEPGSSLPQHNTLVEARGHHATPSMIGVPVTEGSPKGPSAAQVIRANVPTAGPALNTPGSNFTPFDTVLQMLRRGPLHSSSRVEFPMPRTKDERETSAVAMSKEPNGPERAMAVNPVFASSQGDVISSPLVHKPFGGGAMGASPAAPQPTATASLPRGSGRQEDNTTQRRYVASRLGPGGGGGSALRAGRVVPPAGGLGFTRFAKSAATTTPAPAGTGTEFGAGLRQGFLAGAPEVPGLRGRGTPAPPPPLTWTPMRSTPGSTAAAARLSTGMKRKAADSETPQAGAGGSISILDAQRRIRQRSESTSAPSTDRKSWRAGRTPFYSQPSRFGKTSATLSRGGRPVSASLSRPASLSPVPLIGFASGATPLPSLQSTGSYGNTTPCAFKHLWLCVE